MSARGGGAAGGGEGDWGKCLDLRWRGSVDGDRVRCLRLRDEWRVGESELQEEEGKGEVEQERLMDVEVDVEKMDL